MSAFLFVLPANGSISYDKQMKKEKPYILILNGSPQGGSSNCATFSKMLQGLAKQNATSEVIHLSRTKYSATLKSKILKSDAILFVSGTYWDSWGSPLQSLLEKMTELEGHPALMGKPTAVFILMHSVGGKGILSRLQGVLSTFGFLIPPMSGMVYSLVSDIALRTRSSHADDFWRPEDAELILENILRATRTKIDWVSWPVDKKNPARKWLKV